MPINTFSRSAYACKIKTLIHKAFIRLANALKFLLNISRPLTRAGHGQ